MLEGDTLSQLAPLVAPLPPAPDGELFTKDQWATLLAILNVFIAPIEPKDAPTNPKSLYNKSKEEIQQYAVPEATPEIIDAYLHETFDRSKLKESLRRRVLLHVPKTQIEGIAFLLAALNTRLGSLLLTGSTTVIQDQPVRSQTAIICGWSQSYLKPMRMFVCSIDMLAKLTWVTQTETLHKITGFPVIGDHIEKREDGFKFDFRDLSATPEGVNIELDYDIVIIGSGCGAGVVASHLGRVASEMEPGRKPKIIVLEKGYHFPTSHFPMTAQNASENLLEGGGGVSADDGSIAIIAGSTWGGGGTVNWSASLQPQSFVREEWAEKDGLSFVQTAEFQDCLDTVCDRMGVCKMTDEAGKAQIPHNFGNTKLLEGARRLGLAVTTVPQNSATKAHRCGYCSEGCASATKQGPANCWLPDAAQYGVEFMEGCFVDEILWDESVSPKRARALKAEWISRDRSVKRNLLIKTKRVIVSAGTLHSPALLIRSGITHKHVGANLHLHPTTLVRTIWSDRVKPWEGPILTTACTSKENCDGEGHGPKVEIIAGTPTYMLPFTPWLPSLSAEGLKCRDGSGDEYLASTLDYKVQAAKYAHTAGFIAIQRDRDTGRVFLEPKDPSRRQLRIAYTASARDYKGILEGMIVGSRIAYAAGAREIRPINPAIQPFIRSEAAGAEVNDEAFAMWVKEARTAWLANQEAGRLGSAHQMGSCRMSSRAGEGVVNSEGKVWGTQGVYIADASIFPSASGVNPMVTNMGLSEWIARGIARELKAETP